MPARDLPADHLAAPGACMLVRASRIVPAGVRDVTVHNMPIGAGCDLPPLAWAMRYAHAADAAPLAFASHRHDRAGPICHRGRLSAAIPGASDR